MSSGIVYYKEHWSWDFMDSFAARFTLYKLENPGAASNFFQFSSPHGENDLIRIGYIFLFVSCTSSVPNHINFFPSVNRKTYKAQSCWEERGNKDFKGIALKLMFKYLRGYYVSYQEHTAIIRTISIEIIIMRFICHILSSVLGHL